MHRWAERTPDRVGAVFAGEDGIAARADLRGALPGRDAARGGPRAARGRARRPGRHLPAHVPRGGGGLARVRAHRRDPDAALLRLRRAGRDAAAAGLGGQGRDHRGLLAPPRAPAADARDRRGGGRAGAVGRAHRHLGARLGLGRDRRGQPRRAAAARGGLRAPVPPHLHLGHDRQAEGRRARPGRLPRLHRARGRLPGRRAPGRRPPLRHGHGLDHGAVDGGGRGRARLQDRLRRGRSGQAGRPALAAGRVRARLDPRPLADARAGAHSPRRPDGRPLLPPGHGHDGRAVEPGSLPLALREGRRRALPDHQLLGRDRDRRVLPLAHAGDPDQGVLAGRARDGDGDGRRRRGGASRWSTRARWASSSAGGRFPG